MKKIYWIPIFLLLTLAGDRLGGWLLGRLADKSQFRYTRLYDGQAAADIVLLGNSRGLMFYQPHIEKVTGRSSLNLSYNGLPINVGRCLVEDYFARYPAPERLIVDVTMCDRFNNSLMAGFGMYVSDSDCLAQLIQDSIPKVYHAGRLSHLYRYNSELFQRTLAYLSGSDEGWTNERTINDFLVADAQNLQPYTITFEEAFADDLVAIADLCNTNDTKLYFVVNPYFPAFAKTMTNLDSIKQVITHRTGVEVRDYSRFLQQNEDFSDYQHTNTQGSVKYINRLRKDGVLP